MFSKENLCFIIRIYGVQITLDDVNFTEQCFHKRAAEEKREGWSTFLKLVVALFQSLCCYCLPCCQST